jgi:hypothetical protein
VVISCSRTSESTLSHKLYQIPDAHQKITVSLLIFNFISGTAGCCPTI